MINIYGSPRTSAGRCFWCLEEAGVEYKNISIDMRSGEHRSEDYLKINPNGKVPALTDGDFNIWESMGINYYIADTYKPELLGRDTKERAIVQQWSLWSIAELQPPLIDAFIEMVFVPEDKRSQDIIDKALGKLPRLLNILDTELGNNKYLAGNKFSLADINTCSVVSICEHIGHDINDHKNIIAWQNALSDRPAFQRFKELCK